MPPQPAPVVVLDRPRPEIRIERALKLDDFTGFDPGLAAWLATAHERQTTVARKAESAQLTAQLPTAERGEAR